MNKRKREEKEEKREGQERQIRIVSRINKLDRAPDQVLKFVILLQQERIQQLEQQLQKQLQKEKERTLMDIDTFDIDMFGLLEQADPIPIQTRTCSECKTEKGMHETGHCWECDKVVCGECSPHDAESCNGDCKKDLLCPILCKSCVKKRLK